jgi:hypothetical protein
MSVFIKNTDGSTVIGMDAVEVVTYSRSVNVSTTTMFNGSKISDHARSDLPVITFNGIVTNTKVDQKFLKPNEFRKALDTLVDSGQLMSFYGTRDGAIPNLKRCYITSFEVSRGVTEEDSLLATITLRQLDINNSLQKTTLYAPSQATDGQMASNPDSSKSGSKTENTKEIRKTVLKAAGVSLADAAENLFN